VRQSNKYFEDIGSPKNIATIQSHIGEDLKEFFDENSIDLCLSRNFLMHLSNEDLEAHFAYIRRILKVGGNYIFATLNPDYELLKVGESMENGQVYSFAHGKVGEYGTFYHYYRTAEFFDEMLGKYFTQQSMTYCLPITDKYKDTHERYYNKETQMAKVYVLEVIK
jgi:predicted SAM-dependent methyltransferase